MSVVKYEVNQNISLKDKRDVVEMAIQLSCDFWMENSTVKITDEYWKENPSFILRMISDNSSIEVKEIRDYQRELFYGCIEIKLNKADSDRVLFIHLPLQDFKDFIEHLKLEKVK